MPEIEKELAEHQFPIIFGVLSPQFYPPKSPTQSAGPRLGAQNLGFELDQNFDHFLTSIFGRFGVVLGRQLGVIFGLLGGQVGPSSLQNAS